MKSKQKMNLGFRGCGITELHIHSFSGFIEKMWAKIIALPLKK